MIGRNRQPYIKPQSSEQTKSTIPENSNSDDISTMIVDTLKLLSKNIENTKQSLKQLEEKFEYMEERQRKLEDQLGRYNTISNIADSDLSNIRNELKMLKRDKESPQPSVTNYNTKDPIMEGTGFASITPAYLRSLQNK